MERGRATTHAHDCQDTQGTIVRDAGGVPVIGLDMDFPQEKVSTAFTCPHVHAYVSDAKRVRCGAKRHRDGLPCQALSVPGKKRCRFHGGMSTGPKTPEGRAKALANLRGSRAGV